MFRRKHPFERLLALQHATRTLCGGVAMGVMLAALPLAYGGAGLGVATAYAQQDPRATQILFLAVDKNDLPGVQAAIDGGADIMARDFNGMQAVDLAIERGYFDIAHYLISLRNQHDANGPAPAQQPLQPGALQAGAPQPAAPTPQPAPAPAAPNTGPSPFDAPRASDGLPVIGEVREPTGSPAPVSAQPIAPSKPSASKAFVTTFFDFFKPPNTTGIVRKNTPVGTGGQDALTDDELAQQLKQIEAERGNALIKGSAVPISPDELARELPPAPEVPPLTGDAGLGISTLPPYRVTTPGAAPVQTPEVDSPVSSGDAFGDLEVADVTAADDQKMASLPAQALGSDAPVDSPPADPSLPFGGGVDPDILALLGKSSPPPTADPFADQADPFADQAEDPFADVPADAPDTVAGVLEGLDAPQEVSAVQTHKPPPPSEDPFATTDAPPPGDVDELAGLLEGIGEKVSNQGWDVTKVEGADLPSEMPVLADIAPTGEPLDGVTLALGADTVVGQTVGEDRLKMMAEETIHKPCLQKGGPETVFCVDKVSWPFELEDVFLVDTIMYQGTRAISRYDAGRATYFHSLFNTVAFNKVVNYYIERFGQPSQVVQRAIAPLAQPRRDNPTYLWHSREPGTDTVTTLEIREFDDARGSFPDTKRGVALLYRAHAGGIFPQLSQLELMVLKDSGALDLAPKTPDSVW